MSWKEYQQRKKSWPFRIPRGVLLGLLLMAVSIPALLTLYRSNPDPEIPSALPFDSVELLNALTPEILSQPVTEVTVNHGLKRFRATLSLDTELQRFIQKKLRAYRVDWGGVAVIDSGTGEVLALASHSEKEAGAGPLALRATFPAASIFKIVTATAALDQNLVGRTSSIAYRLRSRRDEGTIRPSDISKPGGNNVATVEQAFAKSENKVFGQLGLRVGGATLLEYAGRFGFNARIPFELAIGVSLAGSSDTEETDEDEDAVDSARMAAGFRGATLSPLHGALIASAVVNGGRMVTPRIVQRVTDDAGTEVYRSGSTVWTRPMSEETARELRLMMAKTIARGGTAHRGFRRLENDRVLGRLDIGGKTGSLTGQNPPGKNLWFVGYAAGPNRSIAIGMVLVHHRIWRVKPAQLSREILDSFFSRPTLIGTGRKETTRRKETTDG
ncbi:MAG: penicillin-binding transpeptidase domain-containing protein [Pseudomonadota bacterium]